MNNVSRGIPQKALLLGHFSTVGDIACLDFVTDCLREQRMLYDTCAFMEAVRKNIPRCLSPGELNPKAYSHLIFVCGPCWPELFARNRINLLEFSHACRIGINTTMIEPVGTWNPFQHLLERDSDRQSRPDLSFFTPINPVPVVGLCLIGEQGEYGGRQRHKESIGTIQAVIEQLGWARLELDTRWPVSRNATNVRNPTEFYSLMRKVDLVITNRLHALVFALKAGVPTLAVDSIAGGDKVSRQAVALGWPTVFRPEDFNVEKMMASARWCVSDEGRREAQGIAEKIKPVGNVLRTDFLKAVEVGEIVPLDKKYGEMPSPAHGNEGLLQKLKGLFGR